VLLDASLVSVMSGAHIVAWDLWKRVILPRLAQRFGKRAVKPIGRRQAKQKATPKTKSVKKNKSGSKRAGSRKVRKPATPAAKKKKARRR
jgi:hypothetical protein